VLHGQTAVHHEWDAGGTGERGGRVVPHAFLQPDQPRGEGNRFADQVADVLAASEDVDDVNRVVGRSTGQCGVRPLTEDVARERIDGNDAVTRALQIARDGVTGTTRIGRQSDDGDRASGTEQRGEGRVRARRNTPSRDAAPPGCGCDAASPRGAGPPPGVPRDTPTALPRSRAAHPRRTPRHRR